MASKVAYNSRGSWLNTHNTDAPYRGKRYTAHGGPHGEEGEGDTNSKQLAQFVGKPTRELHRSGDGYARGHYTLPEAFQGSRFEVSEIYNRAITADEQVPVRMLLPWQRNETSMTIAWDEINFHETLPTRVPHEGVSRMLSMSKKAHQASMVRQGIALIVEHFFWRTEQGRQNWREHMQQMRCAITEAANLDALVALQSCAKVFTNFNELHPRAMSRSTYEERLRFERDRYCAAQKFPTGLRDVADSVRQAFDERRMGSRFVFVLPRGMKSFADRHPASMQPEVDPRAYGLPSSALAVAGIGSFWESRSFVINSHAPAYDPLEAPSYTASFNYATQAHLYDVSADDFRTSMQTIRVYDMSADKWVRLTPQKGLRNCGLFVHDVMGDDGSGGGGDYRRWKLTQFGVRWFAARTWSEYMIGQDMEYANVLRKYAKKLTEYFTKHTGSGSGSVPSWLSKGKGKGKGGGSRGKTSFGITVQKLQRLQILAAKPSSQDLVDALNDQDVISDEDALAIRESISAKVSVGAMLAWLEESDAQDAEEGIRKVNELINRDLFGLDDVELPGAVTALKNRIQNINDDDDADDDGNEESAHLCRHYNHSPRVAGMLKRLHAGDITFSESVAELIGRGNVSRSLARELKAFHDSYPQLLTFHEFLARHFLAVVAVVEGNRVTGYPNLTDEQDAAAWLYTMLVLDARVDQMTRGSRFRLNNSDSPQNIFDNIVIQTARDEEARDRLYTTLGIKDGINVPGEVDGQSAIMRPVQAYMNKPGNGFATLAQAVGADIIDVDDDGDLGGSASSDESLTGEKAFHRLMEEPISGAFPFWCLANDVPLPVGFIYMRPHICMRTCMGMGVVPGRAGRTFYGFPDFQVGDDPIRKVHIGHLTFHMKSVVMQSRAVVHCYDMLCKGYVGGNGTRFYSWTQQGVSEYQQLQSGARPNRDMWCIPTLPSYVPRDMYLHATGRLPNNVSSISYGDEDHYPKAQLIANTIGFRTASAPRSLREYKRARPQSSLVCMQALQFMYNPSNPNKELVVQDQTHLGPNVYPGCLGVWSGNQSYLSPVKYAETHTVAITSSV